MNRRRLIRFATATALVVGLASAASAQSGRTATMAVSVEVTASCTVAAEPLAFGTASATEAATRGASATIEVACVGAVPFTVGLDDGQNFGGGTRRAVDPATGAYLSYEIYADAARTRRWGASGAEAVVDTTAADGSVRLTAYGAIEDGAHPAPGRYGDLVTVTANF